MPTTGRLIDISPRVDPQSPVWRGDTSFSSRRVMDVAEGASCNVTTITTTVHVGAHADAPLHFTPGGADAASVPLEPYVGPARVVRMPRKTGITRGDVAPLDLRGVARLLLHTRAARAPRFQDPFAWLEPEAARDLAGRGLKLFGIDTLSVDQPDSKAMESHRALLEGGCLILEGLELTGISPGDYELLALPLRLVGCDASPVRAVLRELKPGGAKRGLPRRLRGGAPQEAAGGTLDTSDGETMNVNCMHSRLSLAPGETVYVTLDGPANVMLLDDSNYEAYAEGVPFNYHGGWSAVSPVELTPPRPGTWNLVVDGEDDDAALGIGVRIRR